MKFLKDPLLHFLLLGALIFGLSRFFGSEAGGRVSEDRLIRVPADKIEELAEVFTRTWQRSPSREELQGLVRNHVLEEASVREALNMGLEADDTIIRRRLRQKLESLTGGMMVLTEPKDAELEAYLAENPEPFFEDARVDLRQVFFAPEKLGGNPEDELAKLLGLLRDGQAIEGHPTLLPGFRPDAPLGSIEATFGADFARRVAELPVGEWHGPLRSGFGLHLVRVERRTPARLPELDEVRQAVQREWARTRQEDVTRRFHEELLERYEVEVEWPEPEVGEP